MIETELRKILENRSILMIGVKFYHYNDEIIRKMESYGANVSFFYERDTSLLFGLVKFLKKGNTEAIQRKHYQGILKRIAGRQFDYLLVIKGYRLEGAFVESIRKSSPRIRTIMYQWDSYSIWDCDYRHLIPFFDSVTTFDYNDSEELHLGYVPTFSTDEFGNLPQKQPDYDLFFCGNYTYPRYLFLKKLIRFAEQRGYSLKTKLVMTWKYYLQERWHGIRLDPALISFRKLSKEEYVDHFSRSLVIVDFTSDGQAGLTMRSLDALSAGKKLLTNNPNIFREPGVRDGQVAVYNPEALDIDPAFMTQQTFEGSDYSIERWLLSVFSYKDDQEGDTGLEKTRRFL